MMGYKIRDTIGTTDCPRNGWYRSGDVGYINKSGYIVITDRVKDIIKYKGFQVAPSELEELLYSHPQVREAAVCGIWDDAQATELPTAFVVLRQKARNAAAAAATAKSLVSFAASRVANYKRLRGGIVILDELPKNLTGKVLKRRLEVPKDWTPEPVMARL
jgi:acyl-coenzyme A synthetase/AMP-(fatty) acid ligase